MLGSVFLKDRYSVYDFDNFKMALAPVFDFDAVTNDSDSASGEGGDSPNGSPQDGSQKTQPEGGAFIEISLTSAIVFGASLIMTLFVVYMIYKCMKRRKT